MKRKILKQVIRNNIQTLICVAFILASTTAKSQTIYWGNQGELIGTSDARMAITILESDTSVELQVTAIGEILAGGFGLTLIYQPNALMLTDHTYVPEIPCPAISPGDFQSTVIRQEASFVQLYPTFRTLVLNHKAIVGGSAAGMHCLSTEVGSSDLNPNAPMHSIAHEVLPVYRIFFKKKVPGTSLQTSDIGFFYNYTIPRTCSLWAFNGIYVSSNKMGVLDFHYENANLFTYRSPSEVKTFDASNLTASTATLNGNFIRGKFMPDNNVMVSGYTSITGAGRLNYDTIKHYGFIYSLETVDITMKEFLDSIVINGVNYAYPSAIELAAGTFIRAGKTFYIVAHDNTVSDRSVDYSENLTGLIADINYYYWSFMKYAFETSGTYFAVGERKMFRTPEGCTPPQPPIVLAKQTFCTGAMVADLVAYVDSGSILVWYDASNVLLNPTELLVDGATYYAKASANDCESDAVEVMVTLHNNLMAPTATTPQIFCSGALVANLQPVETEVQWYNAETGGNLLSANEPLVNEQIYYASQTTGECVSVLRTAVKVFINDDKPLPPFIATPQYFCEDAILNDIATDGSIINWYDANGTLLPSTTLLNNNTIYYAATKTGDCESVTRTPVLVYVGVAFINPPMILSPQRFCHGATLADIKLPNNRIIWYATATGNTPLPIDLLLADSTIYYAAQGAGSCESDLRTPVQIFFNEIPAPVAISPQTFCGTGITLADLNITGSAIIWHDAMTGGNVLPATTLLNTYPTTYFAAQQIGDCEGSRVSITANANPAPVVSAEPAGAYTNVGEEVTITITDDNTNSAEDAKTAIILDPNIADITLTNDILTVTGKNIGNTEIIYTSIDIYGCVTAYIIPVQVGGNLPTAILLGKDIIKCNVPGGGDTTSVQIAYIMGGVAPWTVTIQDDRGTFSKDTIINSITDFPVNVMVTIPENTGNVPEFTTYTITNVVDSHNASKQTHYGAVRIGTNPTPIIEAIANKNQVVCAGENTLPISFDGVATTYRWSIDKNIGLMNYSIGNIPSFNVVYDGEQTDTAKIMITPEFWYNGLVCIGTPDTATLIIRPRPMINAIANQMLCSNDHLTIIFSGNADEYHWTCNSSLPAGIPNTGSGNIIDLSVNNTYTVPVVAAFIVIPKFNTEHNYCEGTPVIFTVTIQVEESVAITKQPESIRVCENNAFSLSVTAEGVNLFYQWYRNNEAIPGANAPVYTVEISNDKIDYGVYYVEVSGGCGNATSQTVTVEQNTLTLFTKWTDVIFISNKELLFVAYQWYKDGKPIAVEGKYQSYVEKGGLNGTYQVVVTYADGTQTMSCPFTVNMTKEQRQILIYPNPVAHDNEVTIDMSQYLPSEFENAKVEILDIVGKQILATTVTSDKQKILMTAPSGVYILRIATVPGEIIIEKIVVQ